MVKLDRISVSGFKNIEKADLEIGDFNLVVGANNVGKSNLLQVFSFLNYVINGSQSNVRSNFDMGFFLTEFGEIAPMWRNARKNNTEIGKIRFELFFTNEHTSRKFEYVLEIGWKNDEFRIEYAVNFESLYFKPIGQTGRLIRIFERNIENTTDEYTSVKWGDMVGSKKNIDALPIYSSVLPLILLVFNSDSDEFAEMRDAVKSLNAILKSPTIFFSNHAIKDKDGAKADVSGRQISIPLESEILTIIEDESKKVVFENAIKDILGIEEIYTFEFPSPDGKKNKMISLLHKNQYKKYEEFSDGTMLVLALICRVLNSKSSFILIEEPENSVHPKALLDMIDFLKTFLSEKQFIISSHSIALINNSSVDEVIVGQSNSNGMSEFCNVKNKKEIVEKLKNKYSTFSDNLFFTDDDDDDEVFMGFVDDKGNVDNDTKLD